MQIGTKISAAGHGALIVLALFGLPWFGPRDREAIRVTEVSFVSEAEFAAAQSAAPEAPRAPEAPAKPPAPRPPRTAPEAPEEAPAMPQDEVAALEPPTTVEPAAITPRVVTLDPPTAAQPPRARPVQRVQPTPAPPPDEDLRPAETAVPAPSPVPAEIARPEPPAAPPEAAPETAPEEIPPATLALATSGRPRSRPDQPPEPTVTRPAAPERVANARPPEPKPETVMSQIKREVEKEVQRRATPATPPTEPTVTAATEPDGAAATSLPVGSPMTSSEKNGLKLAVQRCWNVPAGLRDAQELKVTLAAELQANGQVINASIRLVEPLNPDARFKSAYEAGRRALIRCSPYADLPREKYAQWKSIEVVFNPEGMVSW